MSHEATNWAFKQRGLKPAAKIVLLALADRHNPDMGCFPSKKTIAEDCELSERGVYDQIRLLEAMGLIFIEEAPKMVRGQFTSNRYILAFEPDFPKQDLPSAKSAVGKEEQLPSAKSAVDRRQNLPTNPVREPCNRTSKVEVGREAPATAASQQDLTDREVLLDAMGVDPSGMTGPSGSIGGQGDMAEAGKWAGLGLSLSEQAGLIREMCQRQRSRVPGWMPRGFGYFSQAMADLAARKATPLTAGNVTQFNSERDRKLSFLRKVAGK